MFLCFKSKEYKWYCQLKFDELLNYYQDDFNIFILYFASFFDTNISIERLAVL